MYTSINLEKESLLSNTNSILLTASAHLTNALDALDFLIVTITSAAHAIPIVFESQRLSGSAEKGLIDTFSPSYNISSIKPSVNLYD